MTRVPLSTLRAIEAGDEENLPAPVFLRGFVRAYAKCVGLDPQAMMRALPPVGGVPIGATRPGQRTRTPTDPIPDRATDPLGHWMAASDARSSWRFGPGQVLLLMV